jgi:hypothetical protein
MAKKKSGFFAWSDLYGGGEVGEVERFDGTKKSVVLSRNITRRGESVSQADLKVSDEEWDHLIESGSIRPYPVPEEADTWLSPAQAVMDRLTKGTGEIDQNLLMEMALSQSAEDADEVPSGV